MKSPHGWLIVASPYLDHDQGELSTRLRLFGPDGKLKLTSVVLQIIEDADVAPLFGGKGELLALTSWEEHAYNTQTEIWLLPDHGDPKVLLSVNGEFRGFIGENLAQGVRIARQTYDGVDAKTKGTVQELYMWNAASQSLMLRPQ